MTTKRARLGHPSKLIWVAGVILVISVLHGSARAQATEPDSDEATGSTATEIGQSASSRSGPFRLGFEGFLGGGINDNISRLDPPPDFPFTLGRAGFAYQLRGRVYFHHIGAQLNFAQAVDPFEFRSDSLDHTHKASAMSLHLVATLHTELFDRRWRLEPMLGIGIRHELIKSWTYDRGPRDELYKSDRDEFGPVVGVEQTIHIRWRLQARSIATVASYSKVETRVKFDLQYLWEMISSEPGDGLGAFLSLGVHLTWKDHDRIERMLFFGLGVGSDYILRHQR